MHVFLTGATGWVGSAIVKDMTDAGHRVTGLARSDSKAAALAAMGAEVVRGTLDDLAVLRDAAAAADAVIHTAFNHEFTDFAADAEQDWRAIEAMGGALEGSERPLVVTSGIGMLAPGRVATEADVLPPDSPSPRKSEAAAAACAARGVRAAVVRLAPSTHGLGDYGFVPILIAKARAAGVSGYVGDGQNRWPGVYRNDAARLYRLVLENGVPDTAYHATAEEGVPFKAIAEAIGRGLGLPVEPRPVEHFGWFGLFVGMDMPASSVRTRETLGWQPIGPGLLADLDQPGYFTA